MVIFNGYLSGDNEGNFFLIFLLFSCILKPLSVLLSDGRQWLWIHVLIFIQVVWRVCATLFYFGMQIVCFIYFIHVSIGNHRFYVYCFHYRLPPPSSLEMLIPANAAGKVIGKGGANIANIRKVGLLLSTFHYY